MPRINVCLSKLKIHINTIGNFQTKYSSAFIKNTLFYRLYSLGRRSQIVSKVSCHPETRLFSNNENSHKRYSLTLLLLQRNGAIFELIAALLIFLKLILQKRGVRIVMGALSVKVTQILFDE